MKGRPTERKTDRQPKNDMKPHGWEGQRKRGQEKKDEQDRQTKRRKTCRSTDRERHPAKYFSATPSPCPFPSFAHIYTQDKPVIVSINSDNQLVLQNLVSRRYAQRLCERLKKYEEATVQDENEECKGTVCIMFENYIWESWSSKKHQMVGRRVMIETIRFLESEGYRLVTNFKVTEKKADTFFFDCFGDGGTNPSAQVRH